MPDSDITFTYGDTVDLEFVVLDLDGTPVAPATVTLTVTADGGAPVAVATTTPETGVYVAAYLPPTPGLLYTARLTYTGAATGVLERRWLVAALDPAALTVAQLREYLVDTSASDSEIADALTAERFAQAARCRIDPYTPDLLQALKRRVARNLAARRVPVASFTSFDGGGTSQRVPTVDAEVRRLEGPYRRITVG
jgi:hypothetical protein